MSVPETWEDLDIVKELSVGEPADPIEVEVEDSGLVAITMLCGSIVDILAVTTIDYLTSIGCKWEGDVILLDVTVDTKNLPPLEKILYHLDQATLEELSNSQLMTIIESFERCTQSSVISSKLNSLREELQQKADRKTASAAMGIRSEEKRKEQIINAKNAPPRRKRRH